MMWYTLGFEKDTEVLQLNDVVLTNAMSEMDQASRLYGYENGSVFMLRDTFEEKIWQRILGVYDTGSIVQFDYVFDIDDERFEVPHEVEFSTEYVLGTDSPTKADMVDVVNKPITHIRVKVKDSGDEIGDWTYTGTVAVDKLN